MWKNRLSSMVLSLLAAALVAGIAQASEPSSAGQGEKVKKWPESRIGIVVLQFDDGTVGHYTHAFRILEKYGLKGSFGVVTGALGRSGRLTAAQVAEMHRSGHEIHDHTLDHNAAFWGDPRNQDQWKVQIDQSLGILKKLGIETRGWNQPGGQGQAWTPQLRQTLAPYYDYVAGRVGLKRDEMNNVHWRLRDDPFCLGYGGVSGWPMRGTKEGAAKEVERMKTQIADGIAQGLVAIPLFHVIREEDGGAWGLEEICRFIRAHDLPTMVMADAVKAVQNPRKFFGDRVEQMPNPGFAQDLDDNGRPDGYLRCRYAPNEVKLPSGGRVVEISSGTTTWVYGPETGPTRLTLMVRSGDGAQHTVTPVLTVAEINDKYEYRWREKARLGSAPASADWQTIDLPFTVEKDVDRVKVEFEVTPPGRVYLGKASWQVTR